MHFQFDMSSLSYPHPARPAVTSNDTSELLRQLIELQREQVGHLRTLVASQDALSRWRAFLARWRQDFPDLSEGCRHTVPVLEKTYGKLIAELTEYIYQNGPDALENDFGLQEFLDRYGMRLAQLGTLLNLVAPLAENGSPSESA